MRDTIRFSHPRLVTRELGQPIRNDFPSHESQLAGSPLAIRDSSLAIRNLSHDWRVRNRNSPIVTRDLRLLGRESRGMSHGSQVPGRDSESCIWLADLTCGSQIAKHAHEWRAASRDS